MRIRHYILFAVALSLAGCASQSGVGPINPHMAQLIAAVRVNPAAAAAALSAYRKAHGFGPVRLDAALTALAQRQADATAAAGQLSHDLGGDFASRLAAAAIDAPRAAENLGGGYLSMEEAFAGWRDSPEHNANLLMPQAARFGIAIAKNARTSYGVYWAMEVAAEPDAAERGSGLALVAPAARP